MSFIARPSLRASTTLSTTIRALSTTTPAAYHQPRIPNSSIPIPNVSGRVPLPEDVLPSPVLAAAFAPKLEIPAYPYGPRRVYHQSNTGLYGSALIRFGNNVSKRNEIKTRRKWRPNVQQKRLWSKSLGVFVRTRVTTRVLRTIDKVGGLDEYLLGHKAARVKELGPWGWMLRWRIMQTPEVRNRFYKERKELGLPKKQEKSLEAELLEFKRHGFKFVEGKEPKSKRELKEEVEKVFKSNEESGEDVVALGEEKELFMEEEPKPKISA
ncbi:hypothetical protein B0T20DRAFT_414727 [Sordaria brevicollis]|uniref:Large ribosomal subunit protein bL28m n=1 Tax=Sordaria brevicollis TaxID=83679 RepID=A0AAE0PBI4_SORBR|nr:hypothetical protein B0T20DRAFT_414727 [Sordaria brevicollis]